MNVKPFIISILPANIKSSFVHVSASSLGRRFVYGAFWSLLGAITSRVLGLVSTILVARILGKTGFGELGIIQSTVGMFGTFAGFSLGITATKFIAEFRTSDPARAGRIRGLSSSFAWITSIITSLVLFFLAHWLAENTLAAPHLAGFLKIGSLFLFLTAINGAQTGALSGFEAFKSIAKINLFCGVINLPLMVGGVYLAGIHGALWGMVVATAINWLLNHITIRKECAKAGVPYTFYNCWAERKVLWDFSLPAVLAGISSAPLMWVASALLVNQPNGYAEMGIYNAVLRIKQVPEMILGMLMTPILPILSDQFGKNAKRDYNRTLKYAFLLSITVVVPAALVQLSTPQITLLPYGKDFIGNLSVVKWLMLHTICVGLFSPISSIISSLNKMWFGFATNLFWGILFIALAYALIPNYGASGLAAAFTLSHIINSVFTLLFIILNGKTYLETVPIIRIILTVTSLFLICFISSIFGTIYVTLLTGFTSSAVLLIFILKNGLISKPNVKS